MSHSIPASSRQTSRFTFTDFKVAGLRLSGPIFAQKYPRTYVKVLVGSEQHQQTTVADRSPTPQWEETLTFPASKLDEQVTVLLFQVSKDLTPVCLASFSDTMDKLGPKGKEISRSMPIAKKYSVTLSFRCSEESNDPTLSLCRVFAVIIGIDKYTHKPPLEGSVHDALQFKDFLASEFEVPDANMRVLTNGAATRDAILDAFRWLTANPRINKRDAIIVYYAGHGSRADAPRDWIAEGGKVETICPIDEEQVKGGDRIHGIPDRTIAGLLRKLSDEKGDNITLIFDCCHSGGMARGDGGSKLGRSRSAPSIYPLPANLDKDIWSYGATRAAKVAEGGYGFRQSLSTHILLAACRPDQTAWETATASGQACGAFSNSLLRNLGELGSVYETNTTYTDLLDRIAPDLTHQHAQCEGKNKDRVLFDGRAPKKDPNAFTLRMGDHGTFEVAVGEIHGLCTGAIFSIREFDAVAGGYREIGLLEAAIVSPQKAVLHRRPGAAHFEAYAGAKAVVKCWNSNEYCLPVFIQNDSHSQPITIASSADHEPRFRLVNRKGDAEVLVRRTGLNSQTVTFERLKSPIADHANILPRAPFIYSPTKLEGALEAISHFHFHLGRSNRASVIDPAGVKIKFHQLQEVDTINRVFEIDGRDLMKGGVATVPPSEDAAYGFTLENWTDYDLYPYLFWFDPADYSIQLWYEPHAAAMAAPLRCAQRINGSITPSTFGIGYGPSTMEPFEFTLAKGEKKDTGFLKLFVSTRYVDMKFVEQVTPLVDHGVARSGRPRLAKKEEVTDTWDAFTARIVVSDDATS